MAVPIVDLDTVANFTITNNTGEEVTFDLTRELATSEATLREDMINHSAKYAFWAALYNSIQRKRRESEAYMDLVRARLSNEARKVLQAETGKLPAAGAVTDYILPNEEYQEAITALNDWMMREDELKYLLKAFDHRQSMLMQLSANLRKELQNNTTY